ncbi:hypothetical protein QFC19_004751 [Naganishia cerealis]|uniref:Uncharacterized protein n=1 Tax=Naganishia cerealis TaxID=610337 RepID=A0ACC2VUS1_9TREE|nr:hypothetical protein QFC19_004751 [Naganishia cerealis]
MSPAPYDHQPNGRAHASSEPGDGESSDTSEKQRSLKALQISIPSRTGLPSNGEEDRHQADQDAAGEQEREADGDEQSDTAASTRSQQLSVRPLARRKSSVPHPPASPTFLPFINNGDTHPSPSWIPQSDRLSITDPAPTTSSYSPGMMSPVPRSATPGALVLHQNHLHYEYEESPRSPLAWRQTFEDAVRVNSVGAGVSRIGGAVSPALSYPPTPAPVPVERRDSNRHDGTPSEGYFAYASRSGSITADGMQQQQQPSSNPASPGSVAVNGDALASPSAGWEKNRIAVAFGPVPIPGTENFHGMEADQAGMSYATQCDPRMNAERMRDEGKQLHGLGFDSPVSRSRLASPSPFESVSLNSSGGSDRSDHDNDDDDKQAQSHLSPLQSPFIRNRQFNTRSTSGGASTAELDLTTRQQDQPSSLSSPRRVSSSFVAMTSHPERGFTTRSPGSRRVSAGGGLWGDVETESITRDASSSSRHRENRPRSPLVGHVNRSNDDVAQTTTTTMKSAPLSRDGSTSSRRQSAAPPSGLVAGDTTAGDGATPSVQPTPRLQAPPAIPHGLDHALLAKLNRPGASSLAWAESGDPFAPSKATMNQSHVGGEGLLKKRMSIQTSVDSVRPSVSIETGGGGGPAATRTPSLQLDHAATPQASGLSHHLSAGPSKLDQVRSQTRMVHLPPKSREEDAAHLERWKMMMEHSRAAEDKRQAERQQRRLEMEKHLAEDMPIWEAEILSPAIIDSYRQYHSRARRAIQSQRFPQDILDSIEHDASDTLRVIKIFQPGSPMHDELKDLLCAWYISRLDEGQGYISDVHHLAGMLLMTMDLPMAFIALRNLLNRPCLRAFYFGLTDEVEAYYRIFENLQGELFPKVYANCKHLGVRLPSSYFTSLFMHQLSFEAAARVWDVILLEGDSHIFRIALAILAILEPRLYYPDRKEITSILDGTNSASLAIVARERERAKQKGLSYVADIDGVLTSLGVTAEAIFDVLQQDEWKESRFDRLCQRELPDD